MRFVSLDSLSIQEFPVPSSSTGRLGSSVPGGRTGGSSSATGFGGGGRGDDDDDELWVRFGSPLCLVESANEATITSVKILVCDAAQCAATALPRVDEQPCPRSPPEVLRIVCV